MTIATTIPTPRVTPPSAKNGVPASRPRAVFRTIPTACRLPFALPDKRGVFVELYQAEWCLHSHKVRKRLTELGLDFQAHQVPAGKDDRTEMLERVGTHDIPVLVTDEGEPVAGEGDILAYLERFPERADIELHREMSRLDVPRFEA
jgi:glutaredoxin